MAASANAVATRHGVGFEVFHLVSLKPILVRRGVINLAAFETDDLLWLFVLVERESRVAKPSIADDDVTGRRIAKEVVEAA